MPIINVNILEGRNKEIKKLLIKNITNSIKDTLHIHENTIRVIINEMPFDNYGVAGLPVKEYRSKIADENK